MSEQSVPAEDAVDDGPVDLGKKKSSWTRIDLVAFFVNWYLVLVPLSIMTFLHDPEYDQPGLEILRESIYSGSKLVAIIALIVNTMLVGSKKKGRRFGAVLLFLLPLATLVFPLYFEYMDSIRIYVYRLTNQ